MTSLVIGFIVLFVGHFHQLLSLVWGETDELLAPCLNVFALLRHGVIGFIVKPLYEALCDYVPSLRAQAMPHVDANQAYWNGREYPPGRAFIDEDVIGWDPQKAAWERTAPLPRQTAPLGAETSSSAPPELDVDDADELQTIAAGNDPVLATMLEGGTAHGTQDRTPPGS